MTQVVTVHTDFGDLNQMAQGLVGRVDPAKVILPGPDPVDAGEWVQFAVTLSDGTPGFAGIGRCVTAVDNGEERSEHQRFDVVIDSLQFDSRGQQIFEHILMLSGYADEAELGDGALPEQVSEDEVENVYTGSAIEVPVSALTDIPSSALQDAPPFEEEEDAEEALEATKVGPSALDTDFAAPERPHLELGDDDEIAADDAEAEEDQPTVPPPAELVEAARAASAAQPAAAPTPPSVSAKPSALNGSSFSYPGGLPFPAVPPRPELPSAQRVLPAPRPKS